MYPLDPRTHVFCIQRGGTVGASITVFVPGWLVTRVRVWVDPAETSPVAVLASHNAGSVSVEPGGCFDVEPNGALHNVVQVLGLSTSGTICQVEYWLPANITSSYP